jgi:hypothetical protein
MAEPYLARACRTHLDSSVARGVGRHHKSLQTAARPPKRTGDDVADRRWLGWPTLLATSVLPTATLDALLKGRPLLHYCERSQAASIRAAGLRPRSWCTITALSTKIADVWLGTPLRKDYVFVFDASSIPDYRGPGAAPPHAADPVRRGTAVEIFLPSGVPASAIIWEGLVEDLFQ